MPVPTETFRNMRRLNLIFAASAVLLLVVTFWLVMVDYNAPWRQWQRESLTWDAAMTRDAMNTARSAEYLHQISELKAQSQRLKQTLPADLAEKREQLATTQREFEKMKLPTADAKSRINPTAQKLERATVELGADSEQATRLRKQLASVTAAFDALAKGQALREQRITLLTDQIKQKEQKLNATEKQISNLERSIQSLQEKLDDANPTGSAAIGQKLRNAPLLDWLNPSERPRQAVVPQVHTDYNFMTVESLDRCASCHFNIDKPQYDRANMITFMERQIATTEGQDVLNMDHPVALPSFWPSAAAQAGQAMAAAGDIRLRQALDKLRQDTLPKLNDAMKAAGLKPLADLGGFDEAIAELRLSTDAQRYDLLRYYVQDARALVTSRLDDDANKELIELYRRALVRRYNEQRREASLPALSDNPVLLAHPRNDLYVEGESKHPMKTMGCTVCHEGQGSEIEFTHSTHTPREIWVDARTGAPVPRFLLLAVGDKLDIDAKLRDWEQRTQPQRATPQVVSTDKAHVALALDSGAQPAGAVRATVGAAGEPNAPSDILEHGQATDELVYSQFDVNLISPGRPAPFAPEHETGELALYVDPAQPGRPRKAVQQSQYWTQSYDWHHVHYMHWEKPMHSLEYVQSSCAKCHVNHYDLKESAPRLFEGRRLFTSAGCANCHAVESLETALDTRKIGPSLVHVKDKLSEQMIASWIWSPKGFRPTTRMPHYFMLENNSSAADVLRTRTEVAALTHYLLTAKPTTQKTIDDLLKESAELEQRASAEPAPDDARLNQIKARLREIAEQVRNLQIELAGIAYEPELPPALKKVADIQTEAKDLKARLADEKTKAEDKPAIQKRLAEIDTELAEAKKQPVKGDVERGRTLFKTIGCLGCHTNMAEYGQQWIVDDLVQRTGISADDARSKYDAMSYNQRHWYAMQYLEDKLELTGPELSGVATKLKAGRTEEQALTWAYDWVRNPRHYHSYTIMPRLRLTEDEALDMASYLLTLERPGYTPGDFSLDDMGKKMLDELVVTFYAAGGPRDLAAKEIESKGWSTDDRLTYLATKLLPYYGCNGCHLINGFEGPASTCTKLDEWGLKDPHKLDFGYYDKAFDGKRGEGIKVWKVAHEGLVAQAPHITAASDAIHQVDLRWEEMEAERRPWLYNKLHNTRVYDRGRFPDSQSGVPLKQLDMAKYVEETRPYDKLKMPKFFLRDRQVRALVTYVTSIRKSLVDPALQRTHNDAAVRHARGRQIATMYNCYGCHNIEGNDPTIQRYLNVRLPDGSLNYEALNYAPPRLVLQGARTQPDWLVNFLQDVRMLRPSVKVRMPSFFHDARDQATIGKHTHALADYFAGVSQDMAAGLKAALVPISDFMTKNPSVDNWFDAQALAPQVEHLKAFAVMAELARPHDLDPRYSSVDDRRVKWQKLLGDLRVVAGLTDVPYPFPPAPRPQVSPERFARGEALFNELQCAKCHALGDYDKLWALWKLDNPDAATPGTPGTPGAKPKDPFGDDAPKDPFSDDKPKDQPKTPAKPAPKAPADPFADDAAAPKAAPADPFGDNPTAGAANPFGDDQGAQQAPAGPPFLIAPNLGYAVNRLQHGWIDGLLQEPATLIPGTKMPQWFGGGHNVFAKYPEPVKSQREAMYGYTGKDQRQLLIDFIYAAGERNYTPGEERLNGIEKPKVEIKPLDKPKSVALLTTPGVGDTTTPAAQTTTDVPPTPTVEPKVSAIKLQEVPTAPFQGTRIMGVAKWAGPPVRRKPIDMRAQKYCVNAHKDLPLAETLIVNADKSMTNVFVYVKSGLEGQKFDVPKQPVLIDQVGCRYIPHVLGIVAGQPWKIRNSDDTLHNVQSFAKINQPFNEGMPVRNMVLDKRYDKVEMGFLLKCQVHPWMTAHVYVVPHPFFAVSDVEGRFEIKGLPPGKYTLEAIHEDPRIAPVQFDVEVKADTSTRADVTMKP